MGWSVSNYGLSALIICIVCTCRSSVIAEDHCCLHCANLKTNRFHFVEVSTFCCLFRVFLIIILLHLSVFPHLLVCCLQGEKENIKYLIVGKRE